MYDDVSLVTHCVRGRCITSETIKTYSVIMWEIRCFKDLITFIRARKELNLLKNYLLIINSRLFYKTFSNQHEITETEKRVRIMDKVVYIMNI